MIEMKVSECQSVINSGFSIIIEQGFLYKKTNFNFTRKRNICTDEFHIELHKMTGWYIVVPCVSIISREINKLYNNIMGRNDPLSWPTFGFSIDNKYSRKRGRYHIEEQADFPKVIESIKADFFEIALPWFSEIQDIQSIDAHINEKNEDGNYRTRSVSEACNGLIAAHLAENPAFGEMAETYYNFFCQAQSPELAEPILRTRNYFQTSALTKRY